MAAKNSKFAEAFKKHSAKAWDNAKTAEAGDYRITLPVGDFRGLGRLDLDVIAKGEKKGTPVVKLTCTVAEGDYEGNASCNKGFMLGGDYLDRNMEGLVKKLKKLFPDESAEIAALDQDGILEYLMNIDGADFPCEFAVLETEMEDDKTKKTKTIKYFDINGPLAGVEGSTTEEGEESSEAEAETAEDWTPSKGDNVLYTPDGEDDSVECEVKTVNKGKKTATIVGNESGERYSNVPFDELEPAAE